MKPSASHTTSSAPTARYNGELTLLWHNDLLSQKTHPWHSVLYRSMLRLIEELGAEPQA